MSTILSDSHPALALTGSLVEYCDHFLKKHNLNYFQIIRVNQDGSTSVLTNRADFTRFAMQFAIKANVPLVYSCVKKEIIDPCSYYFLWEPNLPAAPVAILRNEFNFANGLTLVERYSTHYYMIAFAAPQSNKGVLDFYLNNIDLLKNYIQAFKERLRDLLDTLESQPFILPPPLQDENLQDMLLSTTPQPPKKKSVIFNNQETYLTPKEHECIQQLSLGLSAKKIGQCLDISHRTVEQYFERAKIRTGCRTKQDLIQLLH
jgi:LuxR family quorum-sensing system transcriptional regulator SolR